jgi:mannose-1-phosphate guanylyltransferase/mannose-6-phosphate isomerase
MMPRVRDQKVRQFVKQLHNELRVHGDAHGKLHRCWGCYAGQGRGESLQFKHIAVKPGASLCLCLELQNHRALYCEACLGETLATKCEQSHLPNENESTAIAFGHKNRLAIMSDMAPEMIAVQPGVYLGEYDMERFEDLYGRPSPKN